MNDVKAKYKTGGAWKARKISKGARGSKTTGRSKGLVPPSIVRNICRRNRSHKLAAYSWWNSKADGNKIQWSSK